MKTKNQLKSLEKINLVELCPESWITKKVNNTHVKIYYVNKGRGSQPKPFIFPNKLVIDKEFMEAIGMYLGDGKLSKDQVHLGFSSIDMDMSRFILDFFLNRFNISLSDTTISIRFKEFNMNILKKWSTALNVPLSKLKIQITQRTKNESCETQITGIILRTLFGKIIDIVLHGDFLEDSELRRAFLRGIFAAEGNIAVNYQMNYIVCINFCLGHQEDKLASLIKKSLKKENISFTTFKRQSKGSLIVRTTGWKNYHKCWKINLFSRSIRKEFQFLNKTKITKFSCSIKSSMKTRLLNISYFSQRLLSYLVGWNPPSLHKFNTNNKSYINIEFLIKLAKIASIPLDEIKENITEFRVNDITPIKDKEFIDFVFDLKAYCV